MKRKNEPVRHSVTYPNVTISWLQRPKAPPTASPPVYEVIQDSRDGKMYLDRGVNLLQEYETRMATMTDKATLVKLYPSAEDVTGEGKP